MERERGATGEWEGKVGRCTCSHTKQITDLPVLPAAPAQHVARSELEQRPEPRCSLCPLEVVVTPKESSLKTAAQLPSTARSAALGAPAVLHGHICRVLRLLGVFLRSTPLVVVKVGAGEEQGCF